MANGTIAFDTLTTSDQVNTGTEESIDTSYLLNGSAKHWGYYNQLSETVFVSFNQSNGEIKNKLEQLRALDNNIKINGAFAKFAPIGVDTKEDLEAVKKIMENKS